ncbi:MAG TPA: trypsin-like peptidase domain-containing protein [Candidatus Ventricola intestinavium]|nr:trypsin-like peptidase domain-containing protein [Candidatus Ventricola intestinavium]
MDTKRRSGMMMLAVGLLAAIAFISFDRDGGVRTKTVYAQGEYVRELEGVISPFSDVVEVVMPCVVGVSNRANTYSIVSGQTELVEQATGSGVVVTTQGHVVTNYHVIEGASDVQVLSQGQYLQAEVVGYDELTDLAVLRVTEDVNLPAVKMGDPEQVRAGDWAIVIGNPLGKQFADTVTVGVVSALNRELEGSSIVKMIQTDAAINSGNSGGGMFNTRGELIGIPSLKFSSSGSRDVASIEGIAMAIPMDVVQPIVNSIIQYGKVTRPKLGISVMTLRGSAEPTEGMIPAGVYVSAVTEGGPAAKAGIQVDDIILAVDGERVTLHTDLTNHIAAKQAGESVTLQIYRIPNLAKLTVQDRIPAGELLDVTVELQLPADET